MKLLLIAPLWAACCFLVSGAPEGAPSECVFPFKYLGQEHTECIDLNAARPWCSTNAVYNGTWAYCAKVTGDLVTNDHFLQILTRAQMLADELNKRKLSDANKGNQCTKCMEFLEVVSRNIQVQKRMYLDQNRRIQGLVQRLKKVADLRRQLVAYNRRRSCRQTTSGGDYLGTKSTTSTGLTCQAWSTQSPHRHDQNENSMFPDNAASRAKNYCRNPSNLQGAPWCYTTNSKVRQQVCSIPMCFIDCKIDDSDKKPLPFCDQFPDMKCPANYKYFKGNCYRAEVSRRVEMHEADKICQSEKGHLASVHSYAENMFLRSLIPSNKKRFWIGLNDRVKERQFRNSDGTPADYFYWKTGEPNNSWNEDCVVLNYWTSLPHMWNDYECTKDEHFICKVKAIKA